MLRESGASSTPRRIDFITDASGILDRPPSRTMTAEYGFSFSRPIAPEVCLVLVSHRRGSRECRVHAAPAVSCAIVRKRNAHEHTGTDGTLRHSLRNGFTAYAVLSPATNSSCHRRHRISGLSKSRLGFANLRRLDTSNGCQDH